MFINLDISCRYDICHAPYMTNPLFFSPATLVSGAPRSRLKFGYQRLGKEFIFLGRV
jgi:hypothetical protein